ncbi:hypothetical protein SUGI_0563630 [Cryptomeria japonica]|nr:hypothetical protein SUGI_0563630 [Cryptomeria japonica]
MAETETVQSPMQENPKAGPSKQELSVSVPCKQLAFGAEAIRHGGVDVKDKINTQLIDALPCLETVATSSVGVDKVDLAKSRQCNIAVVYTPDVLTDVVADLAIALVPDTLRRISSSDCYVRQGLWQSKGDYKLSCKVPHLQISSSVNKLEAGEG